MLNRLNRWRWAAACVSPVWLATSARAADAAGDDHGSSGGTLPQLEFDTWASQAFWLLVTFAALYFALSRWILPSIGSVIEDRRDKIADDLDEAARLSKQADAAVEAYERTLGEARVKATAIAGKARTELDEQISAETAAVDAEVGRLTADAEAVIAKATASAMSNASEVAAETAGVIVKKLTKSTPTKAAARAAVAAVSGKG